MKHVRIIAMALLVATALEAAWCIAILQGILSPPVAIGEVFHDSYYITLSVKNLLTIVVFVVAGLGVAFWTSNKGEAAANFQKVAAWSALSGAVAMFLAINWLILKPIMFADMPRRYGEQDMDRLIAAVQFGNAALALGAVLVLAAAITSIVGALLAGKSAREV